MVIGKKFNYLFATLRERGTRIELETIRTKTGELNRMVAVSVIGPDGEENAEYSCYTQLDYVSDVFWQLEQALD